MHWNAATLNFNSLFTSHCPSRSLIPSPLVSARLRSSSLHQTLFPAQTIFSVYLRLRLNKTFNFHLTPRGTFIGYLRLLFLYLFFPRFITRFRLPLPLSSPSPFLARSADVTAIDPKSPSPIASSDRMHVERSHVYELLRLCRSARVSDSRRDRSYSASSYQSRKTVRRRKKFEL